MFGLFVITEEISRQLLASNAKLIIGTAADHPTLLAAVQKTRSPIKIVCVRQTADESLPVGAIDFAELSRIDGVHFADLQQSERCDPNAVAILPFSSGTTGLPKGVMLSHNNITTNCLQFNVDMPNESIVQPTTDSFQDSVPCVLPLFHIYGFTVTMASKLALGCKLVTLSKFAPDTFLHAMVKQQCTLVCMVPPISESTRLTTGMFRANATFIVQFNFWPAIRPWRRNTWPAFGTQCPERPR